MQLRYLWISAGLIGLLTTSSFAQCCHRAAVQGAITTGGNLSIGIADYTEQTEIGINISGKYNNASQPTKTITPALFAGLRQNIWNKTYFAYGLDVAGTFGRDDGQRINSNYEIGPYISLEQMLTCHVMLSGWVQPYQYHYERIAGLSVTTNNFFSTGGIAISYLF